MALGCTNVRVCVENAKPGVKEAFERAWPANYQWRTLEVWKRELAAVLVDANESKECVLLLQAPHRTVDAIIRLVAQLQEDHPRARAKIKVLAFRTTMEEKAKGRPSKRRRLWSNRIFSTSVSMQHSLVGGVVDNSWTLDFSGTLSEIEERGLLRQSEVQSSVQDYLSTTIGGATVKELDLEMKMVEWKKRKVQVVCRNVFAATGWVRRYLTLEELLDVYDVGVKTKKLMKEGWDEASHDINGLKDATQQIPGRILIRCLTVLVLAEGVEEGRRDVGTAPPMSMEDLEAEVIRRQGVREKEQEGKEGSDLKKLLAKNDDAETNVWAWNIRALHGIVPREDYKPEVHGRALDGLRKLQMYYYWSYQRCIVGSFRRFMKEKYGVNWADMKITCKRHARNKREQEVEFWRDYLVGLDAVTRALNGSFWEWDAGSTVCFWRWPECVQKELRDGVKVHFRAKDLPHYWGKQRWPNELREREQLKAKLLKVIKKGYIVPGPIKSLTGFFSVPKGVDDIRIVYDATKSGLNKAIWSPNFFLPTMTSVLNHADDQTWYGDIDIGEMFLNYFLDPELRERAGVDVTEMKDELKLQLEPGQRAYMRWERSLMGVRSSPFNCVKIYLWSEEIIRGDRHDADNVFRWDVVKLNLPGSRNYDPRKPWMYRFDSINRQLAAFVVSYVDDLRTGAQSRVACEKATHTVGSRANYLGEQDATRKRGEASQTPGAWAGSVIISKEGEGLYVTISQEKWDKVRGILAAYEKMCKKDDMERDPVVVDYKQLERDTGFLVHVFMTYENARPYLKGFYLTLNSWRGDRKESGWKMSKRDWETLAEEELGDVRRWREARDEQKRYDEEKGVRAPVKVKAVTRWLEDIKVLVGLFQGSTPALRLIRGYSVARVLYGFGDASGAGFGASWVEQKEETNTVNAVRYRFGRWGKEGVDTSSNYRELRNLLETLESMGANGELSGVEVFLFTDNTTAEAAFGRGSSSTEALFDMVKRLKLLEMLHQARIHVIHVSGKRMIGQGTDGLSRGSLQDGVMQGDDMLAFIPLHLTALERAEGLKDWLNTYVPSKGEKGLEFLQPEGWHERGHDVMGGSLNCDGMWVPSYAYGKYVWAPPPCIAAQCLEQLRMARHKRQVSTHVFVCPRVMATAWQRQLYRSADLVLQIPANNVVWNAEQHEPLFVGIYFPFLECSPWQLKGGTRILEMGRNLQRMLQTDFGSAGPLLQQLCSFARKLQTMPELLVQQLLQGRRSATLSQTVAGKRPRSNLEEEEGRKSLQNGQKG